MTEPIAVPLRIPQPRRFRAACICRTPSFQLNTPSFQLKIGPLLLAELYLNLTVLLFLFGPWQWPLSNPAKLVGYLMLAHLCLAIGFLSVIRGPGAQGRGYAGRWSFRTVILVSLMAQLLLGAPLYMDRLGMSTFSLSAAWDAFLRGLASPAEAYQDRARQLRILVLGGSTALNYVMVFVYPIQWPMLPVGVFFWRKLGRWLRFGIILTVALDLCMWVAAGTNKGIADTVALATVSAAAAASVHRSGKTRTRSLRRALALGSTGLIVVILFFSSGMIGRSGGQMVPLYDGGSGVLADEDSVFLRFLPESAKGSAAALISYASQGYYALSLALEEPFVPCYGLGNSYFFTNLSRRFLGPGTISDRTYPARLETYGWDRFGKWHTFYIWMASDVTFPGTLVVVLLIGRLFAVVWLDVVRGENPFAIALFGLVVEMLLYFPANNQVLAFATSATPFMVMLVLWLVTRERRSRYA